MRTWAGWLALGLVLGAGSGGHAYFLDGARNFDVRLRAYSQLGISTESSCKKVPGVNQCPEYGAGDLAQNRNFYNPEFDAKLVDYSRWMGGVRGLSLIAPDDLRFRFAWWGFYDGLYDYLAPVWNEHRQELRARFSQSDDPRNESFNFTDQGKNPRRIYASRNRINELYVDYTKGPVFLRVGRQAISWGESDSIALLDVQNPFDLTLAAPGFYEDVDEARIPLYTVRSTVKLVDNWKWLSSFFADVYMVPGPIDTTVPINPLVGGVSFFNADQGDPQNELDLAPVLVDAQGRPMTLHSVTVDKLPESDWSNTRWGARLTGILFRDYTVQGWFFRTFNQAPVPFLASPGPVELNQLGRLNPTQVDDRGFRTPICSGIDATTGFGRTPAGRRCGRQLPVVSILERRLESVIGVAATWFSQPLNGIIRTEAEYFNDELAFIPNKNLNARSQIPAAVVRAFGGKPVTTSIPKADFLRFVFGYDRFFFWRAVNPTNSIVLSMAFNGSINISENDENDYRYPNPKYGKNPVELGRVPGLAACDNFQTLPSSLQQLCVKTVPQNFEDLYKFEGFLTTALQTEYLHGRLTPRIVMITDVSGIMAFAPTATYRFTDNFLATLNYLVITGTRKAGLGTFIDHDMVQMRLTYQLN